MEIKKMKTINAEVEFLLQKEDFEKLDDHLKNLGFKNKNEFDNLFGKLISFDKEVKTEIKLKIKKVIFETIKDCSDIILNDKIKVFAFQTNDHFITYKMGGSSGFCTNSGVVIIFISLNNFTQIGLKNTLAHELAHAVNPFYDMENMSIGQGIIFDGLAENFRENRIDKTKSVIVSTLKKEEALELFDKIKSKLDSKNLNDYYELFFGVGKYPLWAGYAVGYYLIKEYLSKMENLSWNEILRSDPNKILKDIISK